MTNRCSDPLRCGHRGSDRWRGMPRIVRRPSPGCLAPPSPRPFLPPYGLLSGHVAGRNASRSRSGFKQPRCLLSCGTKAPSVEASRPPAARLPTLSVPHTQDLLQRLQSTQQPLSTSQASAPASRLLVTHLSPSLLTPPTAPQTGRSWLPSPRTEKQNGSRRGTKNNVSQSPPHF